MVITTKLMQLTRVKLTSARVLPAAEATSRQQAYN